MVSPLYSSHVKFMVTWKKEKIWREKSELFIDSKHLVWKRNEVLNSYIAHIMVRLLYKLVLVVYT